MSFSGKHLCVVLVEPSLPENVGAVARAMHTMGVDDLRLVQPCDHRAPAARQLATHGESILDRAKVYSALTDAVADQQIVIGTSARSRDRHAHLILLPDILELIPSLAPATALVFGRENSGLTNAEMAVCHHWIHIPTHGPSSSLNLSQAVMVTLYELSKGYGRPAGSGVQPVSLATSDEIEGLKQHLFELLREVRFLKDNNQEIMWRSFADLIGRARLTPLDVRLMRGFFHRVQVTLHRMNGPAKCPNS